MKNLIHLIIFVAPYVFSQQNTPSIVKVDSIFSKSLNEYRKFTIFLPPNYNPQKTYPVFYTSDGQTLTQQLYFRPIDSLIQLGKVRPFVMVCAHSKEKIVANDFLEYRNYEYLKSFSITKKVDNHDLFSDHLTFFTNELIGFVEQKYAVSREQKGRYFYGSSNGAALGVSLSLERPMLFGNYVLMSVISGCPAVEEYLKSTNATKFQFNYYHYYGNEETDCIEENLCLEKIKNAKQILLKSKMYQGGHKRDKWGENFINYLLTDFR